MAARLTRPVLLDNTVLTNFALDGVPSTGTIGILTLCVRRGHLSRDQANVLLGEMIALGYRSPVTRLDSLLDKP